MKLSSCYLAPLDCLGLRHAERLKGWVGAVDYPEGRENGDLGAVAPSQGVPLNLQMSETRILFRLLQMYFPRNREFGSALSKLRNFGGEGV
jgi:hypothetical protein